MLFLASLSLINCSNGDDSGDSGGTSVSPSNADEMASVLVIPNAEIVNSSTLPASSDSSVAPVISHVDTNLSYTAGSTIFIPCDVLAPTQNNIVGVYIQVKGASTYFDVPIDGATFDGLLSIPIDLPGIVEEGTFILILKFYDAAGNISLEIEITITVTKPLDCDTTKISGGEGLTSTVFEIPEGATGSVVIEYQTFTVPDKIDIFQDGNWIAGTGPYTVRSTLRKALDCNMATEALGYIGEEGQFTFSFDAAMGSLIEVVVSGCEDGGTAWEYYFSCPQNLTGADGSPRFNMTWSGGTDLDLYVTDPNGYTISYTSPGSPSGGVLDVDCTGNCSGGNAENITWENGGPSGVYEFHVNYFSGSDDTPFTLTIRDNETTMDVINSSLSEGDSQTWTYTKN